VPTGTVAQARPPPGHHRRPPVQTSASWITSEVADKIPTLRKTDTDPGSMYSRFEDAGLVITFDVVTCRLAPAG
jgi:hypothetical protein